MAATYQTIQKKLAALEKTKAKLSESLKTVAAAKYEEQRDAVVDALEELNKIAAEAGQRQYRLSFDEPTKTTSKSTSGRTRMTKVEAAELEQAILDLLAKNKKGLTRDELNKATGKETLSTISKLIAAKKLDKTPIDDYEGRGKAPNRYSLK